MYEALNIPLEGIEKVLKRSYFDPYFWCGNPKPGSLEWRLLGVLGNMVRSNYRLVARIEIAKAREQEEGTIVAEPTIKQVETVNDLDGNCLDGAKRPRRSCLMKISEKVMCF